jgi:hypothetical protein
MAQCSVAKLLWHKEIAVLGDAKRAVDVDCTAVEMGEWESWCIVAPQQVPPIVSIC